MKANKLAAGEETVTLSSLSEMTGFPIDYIKSELLMKGDEVSLEDFRRTMVNYLESTNDLLTK